MKKTILHVLVVSLVIASVSFPSFAGQWQKGQGPNIDKWCYLNDDGSWATNGWKIIDGTFYYFDADGWMLANTTTPDGGKVGADGAWIQEESSSATANSSSTQDDQSLYPVKAPDNVHWTDTFQISWAFGKNRNGQLHHIYGIRVYNENTGECISRSSGTMSLNGTYVTLGLLDEAVEKMVSGDSYYFEVYAIDESKQNQMSPAVRSESKIFTRPDVVLPAPVNLRWEGTRIYFDLPGISQEMANQMHYQLFFSPTKDGQFNSLDQGTSSVMQGFNMLKYLKAPGYYKFRLFLHSKDIQKALTSEYSEFSPPFHYQK